MTRRMLVGTVLVSLLALLTAAMLDGAGGGAGGDGRAKWWKGNLHTHSLWSDGNDFPEMIAGWYRDRDYDFLALSDHNILSNVEKWIEADLVVRRGGRKGLALYRERFGEDWVETRKAADGKLEVRLKRLDEFRSKFEKAGEFLMIQGEEISASFEQLPIHMNASNLAEVIKPRGGESVREVIANNFDAVREQSERLELPILAHLNHPNFYWAVTAEDLAAVVQERFFEVYNGHPSVHHNGDDRHAGVELLWDVANTIRIAELSAAPLFGLGTDDSHNYFNQTGSTPGRGWVMVRASELDAGAIVEAMEAGDFYASSGVGLRDVRFANGVLALDIERDGRAKFETRFVGTLEDWDTEREPVLDEEGKEMRVTQHYSADVGKVLATVKGRKPSYRLTGRELYVRAVVTSTEPPDNPVFEGQRQQAWTQPVGWRGRLGGDPPRERDR